MCEGKGLFTLVSVCYCKSGLRFNTLTQLKIAMLSPAGPDNFVPIHCLEMACDERVKKIKKKERKAR